MEGVDIPQILHELNQIRKSNKQYVGFGVYNGITLSVTAANFTLTRGVFIPYKTTDGAWRLRFNTDGTISVAASVIVVTVAGVTFKTGYTNNQAVTTLENANTWSRGAAIAGTSSFFIETGANTTSIGFSGDVELDSKPTWAD